MAALEPLIERHGEAYPWLGRARDLLELGLAPQASDELYEVFMAWADARGRNRLTSGVVTLFRGAPPGRHRASVEMLRARRQLNIEDRIALADVCALTGDYGLAVRFGGWQRAFDRPRAYERLVVRAAERHDVDPNLLFAIMRVESVYNPRIISYAGAIGLMQIMPRTGHFIARNQGSEDFTVDRLVDPEVNIDFAAWYMSSLIERFDGRIPLAVASYNGGPHNVRLWLRNQPRDLALDAFLETIPIGQTHRYVRRVLTHYEAYRAQEGLPPPTMDMTLPSLEPDSVVF